ncbi:hypothetical protein [Streptacidiphilus fuscans]|uniref:ABM domain-containing protein n=1 Tax=Streptacidiphilus fuscans TaxID=2789292 RepID=A0A931FGL5_9ACTN|nr:hypothetical protein [Streptacidiphilus fuscans]MBF9072753.1 hypothetical protein [Streptacidiphilus fuscans]
MINWVLAEVDVRVAAEHEGQLIAAYHRLIALPPPDGLLQTELLRGQDGGWRIQTLWADRLALEAVRASSEGPTAPHLFRDLDADVSFEIFEVVDEWVTPEPESLR